MGAGTNIGSLFWTTGVDFTGFRRDAGKAKGALSGLFRPAILGAAALSFALFKAGDAALDFSRSFETAFAEVQTISQFARENAEETTDAILRMTTEIPVAAVDATRALYQIVSAGFDGAEAMHVLEVSAKSAVAGVSTTAVAADTLTTIINAYGKSANEAMEISDALFKTVELGKTKLDEIGASFSQVASFAALYKVEVNEVFSAIATLTKQGQSTSEAITNIRSAIIATVEKMGQAIFETNTLSEAFTLAREEADRSGETYREFFGRVQAVAGVLLTTGENAKTFAKFLDLINDSAGATNKGLAIMNDTLAAQELIFKSNLNILLKQFGDNLNRIKKDILPALNEQLKTLTDERLPNYAKALAGILNVLGAPGVLLGLGDKFTAEQFSPEIVKLRLQAEREVKEFNKRTAEFSDEAFNEEVERIKKLSDINQEALKNLLDRRDKGYQFDKDALKEAQQRTLNFYHILEEAEKRLNKIKKEESVPELPKPKVTEEVDIYKELKKQIAEKHKILINASKEEQSEIAKEIVVLERQIKLLEEIADLELKIARNRELKPREFKTTNVIVKGERLEIGKDKPALIIRSANIEVSKLIKKIGSLDKKTSDLDLAETFTAASIGLIDMANSLDVLGSKLGETAKQAAQFASGIAQIVVGAGMGPLGITQIISGAAKVLSSFITTKEISDVEKYEEVIRKLTSAYKDLNFQIDKALGEERVTSRVKAIENIQAQIKALGDLIQAERDSVKVTRFLGITIKRKSNTDFEAIKQYEEQIRDLNRSIQDILDDTTKLITGTTGEDLASAFVDAFKLGEDAAKAFGDVVNDVIQSAVKNALARKFLEQPLQKAIDYFERAMISGDQLTEAEAERFRAITLGIGKAYSRALEQVSKTLGLDFSDGVEDPKGISGAIRKELTQETAGILEGIWRRSLDEMFTQTEILSTANQIQQDIADNTLRTATACESLNNKIETGQNERDLGV